ncbi:phosphoadenosine phosphosulfate reductase [Actinomadura violacea]|uniref:Phosphoadenosine phosphosulfate reductase n=1 Tax=Actinomadura violacea TaxID=2819934 RepID=A0ABS3S7L5_9ACTN|nr:phosphoadenosine phosphosulfate reductase [Actinomadura violacea]MBO2465001.1 phosphoadenosine phosphosulfate reductase [Actinomadura violacea]
MATTHAPPSPDVRLWPPGVPPKTFSFGGGWQTVAALALAAAGDLDYDTFVFANVGDDSENPGTLRYLHRYAAPFAARHGLRLIQVERKLRNGSVETLYGRLMKEGSRSIPIPVRMSNGAPGTRSCTADFKIKVIGRWLKQQGASADTPATVAIGITVDEIERANNRRCEPYENIVYPLLDMGIRRADCPRIIAKAGLPLPPPSSCFFCPHHRMEQWRNMRREEPQLFARACDLENTINRRRHELDRDPVWLTRFNAPLADVVPTDAPLPLDDEDGACDGGWCFT